MSDWISPATFIGVSQQDSLKKEGVAVVAAADIFIVETIVDPKTEPSDGDVLVIEF